MSRTLAVVALCAPAIFAQVPVYRPVGLLLGGGATVQRGAQPAVRAQAGELLFAGDVVRTSAEAVAVMSCTLNAKFNLSPETSATVAEGEWSVKSGSIAGQTPIASCYLPASPKLSLASQQHYGVLAARSGSIPPPTGTFEQRVSGVPEPRRGELRTALSRLDTALQNDPRDAGAHISRAAVLEQSGLLFDAGESYRTAAVMMPGAAWLRRKVIEIENRLLAAQR